MPVTGEKAAGKERLRAVAWMVEGAPGKQRGMVEGAPGKQREALVGSKSGRRAWPGELVPEKEWTD